MRRLSSLSSTMRILGRLMLPPPDGPLVEPTAVERVEAIPAGDDLAREEVAVVEDVEAAVSAADQLAVVTAALVDVPALAGGQAQGACQKTSEEPHGEPASYGSAVRRCRSSGGKYLRASSGTVERSLFSVLVTLPSP